MSLFDFSLFISYLSIYLTDHKHKIFIQLLVKVIFNMMTINDEQIEYCFTHVLFIFITPNNRPLQNFRRLSTHLKHNYLNTDQYITNIDYKRKHV